MKVTLYLVGKSSKENAQVIYVYYLRQVSSSDVLNASVPYNSCCLSVALFLQVDLVPHIIWFWGSFSSQLLKVHRKRFLLHLPRMDKIC